jgi:hypothetical protein
MSDIYGSLYKALEPKRYNQRLAESTRDAYQAAGLSFEEMLEEGLRNRLASKPGELVSEEGIICTPDLVVFNGETRVGEIKLTWMSSREVPRDVANSFPPKFDKYFTQIMAYCHVLETPHARLLAFFVNGDYKPPVPELLAWDIEFSRQELDENWSMLLNHAKAEGML